MTGSYVAQCAIVGAREFLTAAVHHYLCPRGILERDYIWDLVMKASRKRVLLDDRGLRRWENIRSHLEA